MPPRSVLGLVRIFAFQLSRQLGPGLGKAEKVLCNTVLFIPYDDVCQSPGEFLGEIFDSPHCNDAGTKTKKGGNHEERLNNDDS
jgi:hypothetical protein